MTVPAEIQGGDSLSWVQQPGTDSIGGTVSSTEGWTLTTYFRTNVAAAGETVTGVARSDGGWDNLLTAAQTGAMISDLWFWQSTATKGAAVVTLAAGPTQVLASLSYSGSPDAYDGRSSAEKELLAVQAALLALSSGGPTSYSIRGRTFTKADMEDLVAREKQLQSIVNNEKRQEAINQGLGDPNTLFISFR